MTSQKKWDGQQRDVDPGFLISKLRIFLSVDMVNSTAFKQSQQHRTEHADPDHGEQPWFSPIAAFYHGMEQLVGEKWSKFPESIRGTAAPKLWKASGDELIYTKLLDSPNQALACVLAWMESISGHREALKNKYPTLDLKGAAWLAGFPVNNAEVLLGRPEQDDTWPDQDDTTSGNAILSNLIRLDWYYRNIQTAPKNLTLDFIGPSMDTGFRICGLASPRRFALAVDLAYMLAVSGKQENLDRSIKPLQELSFRYEGRVQIKGVDGGDPYPYFWPDMMARDSLSVHEDALRPKVDIKPQHVEAFCKDYFSSRSKEHGHIMVPYIEGPSGQLFSTIPESHIQRRRSLARKLENYKSEAKNAPVMKPQNADSICGDDIDEAAKKSALQALPLAPVL